MFSSALKKHKATTQLKFYTLQITEKKAKKYRTERTRDRLTSVIIIENLNIQYIPCPLKELPRHGYCLVLITGLFFCHPGLEGGESLQVLQLSFNRISTLRPVELSHLRQLKELHLQHNLITSLHPQMFQDLAQLQVTLFF